MTLLQANEFIAKHHRHHKATRGHRFSIGCSRAGEVVGVVVVGRPVARMVSPYDVAEVTRLCADGTPNVCSFLYSRAAQAASAMGFRRIQTYTLAEEGGASLRGVGWVCDGVVRVDGKGWQNREGRRDDQPTGAKMRWGRDL
jgi:hypothetical protein